MSLFPLMVLTLLCDSSAHALDKWFSSISPKKDAPVQIVSQKEAPLVLQELDTKEILTKEILEREEAIRKIEKDVITINHMFYDISIIVHDQGDMIDNIENNINKAAENTKEGLKELQKAEKIQPKYGCCIF